MCVTAGGGSPLMPNQGFPNVTVSAGPGTTDFLSAPVNNEFPGLWCYSNDEGCFAASRSAFATPALSVWAMLALAGILLLFGVWKLNVLRAT